MDGGRRWTRSALWGGIALGVGTALFALCSPSSVGCATNLLVLTRGTVTARGRAAFSVLAHLGISSIVLGAVLLLGSFLSAIRGRRQVGTPEQVAAVAADPAGSADVVSLDTSVADAAVMAIESEHPVEAPPVEPGPLPARPPRPAPRRPERVGPIAPGDDAGPADAVLLPPGWYGNPDNPAGRVQWWDGTKLVDRPR